MTERRSLELKRLLFVKCGSSCFLTTEIDAFVSRLCSIVLCYFIFYFIFFSVFLQRTKVAILKLEFKKSSLSLDAKKKSAIFLKAF